MTTSWSRGMSTLRFLRLCSRAPLMRIDLLEDVVAIDVSPVWFKVETYRTRVRARSSNRALYGRCKAEGSGRRGVAIRFARAGRGIGETCESRAFFACVCTHQRM